MRAGKLNQRILIEQPGSMVDSYGHATPVWTEVATIWAALHNISGRENWANDRVLNDSSLAFRIRFRTDLSEEMRISWRGTYYQISGPVIDPDGHRREQIITVRAMAL